MKCKEEGKDKERERERGSCVWWWDGNERGESVMSNHVVENLEASESESFHVTSHKKHEQSLSHSASTSEISVTGDITLS